MASIRASSSSTREGDDAAGPGIGEGRELSLLDHALAGGEDDVSLGVEVAAGHEGRDLLALLQTHEIHGRLAFGLRPHIRNLVDLQPVQSSAVGEDQDVGVGRGHEQVLDEILLLGLHSHPAAASATLAPVQGHGRPFDVPVVGDRDRHVLVGDGVFDGDVVGRVDQLGPPRVAVGFLQFLEFGNDDQVDLALASEDRLQTRDGGLDLGEFVQDLLPLETGKSLQLELENRDRLDLRKGEARDQLRPRLLGRRRASNEGDHRVEIVESDDIAAQDVGAGFGLAELELDSPADDLPPESDEVVARLEQG